MQNEPEHQEAWVVSCQALNRVAVWKLLRQVSHCPAATKLLDIERKGQNGMVSMKPPFST